MPDHGQFDLVLAGDVERLDRWVERAPVIVLGREQADAVDRIHAFRSGATTTFHARSSTGARRADPRGAAPVAPPLDDVVEAPPVRIDTRTRDVRVEARRVQLAQKEYELLLCLAREPERVFTKSELLRDVWNYRVAGRTRTLDSHASRLRRKLRETGRRQRSVENVWGVGYRLVGVLSGECRSRG